MQECSDGSDEQDCGKHCFFVKLFQQYLPLGFLDKGWVCQRFVKTYMYDQEKPQSKTADRFYCFHATGLINKIKQDAF